VWAGRRGGRRQYGARGSPGIVLSFGMRAREERESRSLLDRLPPDNVAYRLWRLFRAAATLKPGSGWRSNDRIASTPTLASVGSTQGINPTSSIIGTRSFLSAPVAGRPAQVWQRPPGLVIVESRELVNRGDVY
jgi:hypothetical protein